MLQTMYTYAIFNFNILLLIMSPIFKVCNYSTKTFIP